MRYLWSPWRMEYIQSEKNEGSCILCIEQTQPDGPNNLIVFRGQRAFLILNRFPYTTGHLMAVPYDHQPTLGTLDPATRAELMEITTQALGVLDEVYHPQGYNIGINIGEVAGAGITDHIHLHIVPRWGGDTNFMTTLAETRVLPETLEDTYRKVREAWERDSKD